MLDDIKTLTSTSTSRHLDLYRHHGSTFSLLYPRPFVSVFQIKPSLDINSKSRHPRSNEVGLVGLVLVGPEASTIGFPRLYLHMLCKQRPKPGVFLPAFMR